MKNILLSLYFRVSKLMLILNDKILRKTSKALQSSGSNAPDQSRLFLWFGVNLLNMRVRLVYFIMAIAIFAETSIASPNTVANEIRQILEQQSFYLQTPYPKDWSNLSVDGLRDYLKSIDKWSSLSIPQPQNYSAVGIGAELYLQSGKYWLLPYEDGALMNLGVTDRVQLLTIDSQLINNLTLTEVGEKLKKPLGQPVVLGICPVNQTCAMPQLLTLSPQPYRFHSVQYAQIGNHEVIRLLTFTKNTPRLLHKLFASKRPALQLASLSTATEENKLKYSEKSMQQPIIIDLRDNWGGDLMEALNAASLFLFPDDELASFVDKKGEVTTFYSPPEKKIAHRYPLILLVSQRTASAGEIFAGILSYHGAAIVIGEQTFGKCVSQTEKRLSDGQSLLFTNIEVRLPDQVVCNHIGIKPQRQLDKHQVYNQPLLTEILNLLVKREIEHGL